jgi:hypothetical protein
VSTSTRSAGCVASYALAISCMIGIMPLVPPIWIRSSAAAMLARRRSATSAVVTVFRMMSSPPC